ncbi:hypothetical protein BDW59DRAFT_148111 [Aspergillus cavernicola]|uniref:Uncharacterized protein n=1 Tax=Aspergillus cavernicola TaxID=176166 RepID=A0ABR4I8K1_9EURO
MAHNAIGRLFCRQAPRTIRLSINNSTQKRSLSEKTIPSLVPTSSPELDQALTRFREDLFIPFGLSQHHRNLIYRPRHANKLNDNPITLSIGSNDEQYKLRPINKQTLPSRQNIVEVLTLMDKTGNWSNLVPFLTGIHKAGMKLRIPRWEWLVRKTCNSNGVGQLSACVQQASRTGFDLKNASLVQRTFFEVHRMAQRDDFEGESLEKANRIARQLTTAMEAPEHIVHDLSQDPRRRPVVIGILLELSAARALKSGGKDTDGSVHALARRLLACWKIENPSTEGKDWYALDLMLQEIVPVYNAMKLAVEVDGIASDKSIAPQLKTCVNEMGMLIANIKKLAPRDVKENSPIGLTQAYLLHKN